MYLTSIFHLCDDFPVPATYRVVVLLKIKFDWLHCSNSKRCLGMFLWDSKTIMRTNCNQKSMYLSIFTELILFLADLSFFFSSTRSSTVLSSVPGNQTQADIHPVWIHQSLCWYSSEDPPAHWPVVRPSPLSHQSRCYPSPSCTSGEVGPLPFLPRCIWGMRHATDPTHTHPHTHILMEIYPQTLQKQHGCSDGGGLIHPCH